jgi:hypothetical protein
VLNLSVSRGQSARRTGPGATIAALRLVHQDQLNASAVGMLAQVVGSVDVIARRADIPAVGRTKSAMRVD